MSDGFWWGVTATIVVGLLMFAACGVGVTAGRETAEERCAMRCV